MPLSAWVMLALVIGMFVVLFAARLRGTAVSAVTGAAGRTVGVFLRPSSCPDVGMMRGGDAARVADVSNPCELKPGCHPHETGIRHACLFAHDCLL